LGLMEKADVDYIEGLSPAISIDQKGASRNPRSTVATQTEIYDYLRLLFARVGHPHCPQCGRPIERQTVQQIVDSILALPPGKRLMILSPVVRDRKGEYQKTFEDARKAGFVRVRVDGAVRDLGEEIALDKNKRHSIDIVVDRVVTEEPGEDASDKNRLSDSVETALRLGGGLLVVWIDGEDERLYSEHYACLHCGVSFGELEPRNFSFNSPHGACKECTGLGVKMEIDPALEEVSLETSLPAHQVVAVRPQAGGAGTVLANVAALAPAELRAIGVAGDDGEGYELAAALAAMGVNLDGFIRSRRRRTFTYTKPLVITPGRAPEELSRLDIKDRTPMPAELVDEIVASIRSAVAEADVVILMDQATDVASSVLCRAVKLAVAAVVISDRGTVILADSRTDVGSFANVDIKVNQDELRRHFSDDRTDVEALAARWAEDIGRRVFVTLGADGVVGAAP
ncbi:hypothetical protein LCGC14_2633500, partial [marine sediment metagenome]